MSVTNTRPKLVWFRESPEGLSALQNESFEGSLEQALESMTRRSTEPGFLLGQVLEPDGRVHATVACGGSLQVNAPHAGY